jgi:hypothetical protein
MTTAELQAFFRERSDEVYLYLHFLQDIEAASQSGPPRLVGAKAPIAVGQQRILYSSLYLQLYNLVEATVAKCIEAVVEAAASHGAKPSDLNEAMRSEWVRSFARTHVDLKAENRLRFAVAMCDHVLEQLPIEVFDLDSGGGGNWDDSEIEKISKRVGIKLQISRAARAAVHAAHRDNMGALKLVKNRRNRLAHGSLSFVDCSDGVTVAELWVVTDAIVSYLHDAIKCFGNYIDMYGFLDPTRQQKAVVNP